ncbi:MAG TPA: PKD domain-containing protein, partial [Cyclobacteriaceae bacterium]|nr:PKD domain-containing protein [Cyclobacteriaceae bacterium]
MTWGRKMKKLLWLIQIFLFINIPFVYAQNYADLYWLFGQSVYGITYKKSDFSAQPDSIQNPSFGMGGSAVATDQYSGDLLFYSDGNLVYDRGHQLISGYTAGLNSSNVTNQGAVVSPVPGQANIFFIISNTATPVSGGNINAVRINMTLQGNAPSTNLPRYGVMQAPFNAGITNNSSEGMILVANPTGTAFWLITHQRGTSLFNVTPINSTGIANTSTQTYDLSGNGFPSMRVANLSYSMSANRIAVSPQDTSRNVQILNFSRQTGVLSYDTTIYNSANTDISSVPLDNYAIYDTEWSPDGTKLYISRHGGNGVTGMIYMYDRNNPSMTLLPVLSNPIFRSYSLKTGPDNNIYHLYRLNSGGPILTGQISNPNGTGGPVVYTPAIFGNINFNGRQFSETLPYQPLNIVNAGIEFYGDCFGTSTKFFPRLIPPADSYLWDFGDGQGSTDISPVHRYAQPGFYNVSLRATLGGQDSLLTLPVIIQQSDTLVLKNGPGGSILPTDTTICQDETLLLDASQPLASSYTWSVPGESGADYTVDTAGYYWVVGTYAGGCTSYDAINVNEYNFQLQVANQWYFGNTAGVDFNLIPPVALTDGVMNAPEGCTAVSDRNGDILFYSDGVNVYGRTGEILGQTIGGDNTATQSVLAVPFPQDETMYYIFTTREVYGDNSYLLSYSILDIKGRTGADPGIIPQNLVNIPLFIKSTERVTAIGGYGNNAILVVHEYGNNTFRLYPITANGIGNPRLFSTGSAHQFGSDISADGYLKVSPDGSTVAVALVSGSNNYVELFDYDTAGAISNFRQITFQETYPQYQVYGIEFAPTSNKLFVSLKGSTSRIYEFRLDSADINFTIQTGSILAEESMEIGALQLGPDGQIYVSINGNTSLARITANPDPLQPSQYILNGIDLAGRQSRLGLPNYVQNMSMGIGGAAAFVSGFCVGQPTLFSGQPTSSIDNFEWVVSELGDTIILFTSTNLQDTFIFVTAGDYVASLRIFNRCGLDTTIIQTITIKDPPPDPTIPDAMAICTGNEIL